VPSRDLPSNYHQSTSGYDFLQGFHPAAGLFVPSKIPVDSNRLERGTAMALRAFVLLLLAYIVFHKIFPFALFRMRVPDMTGGDLVLLTGRTLMATIGAAYFAIKGFFQPEMKDRDRAWCERWAGLAFGVIGVIVGSVFITILPGKGIIFALADWLASGILWLLF
jgi:hypothetical protein